MPRSAAVLAARLSGRLVLMRETELRAYARLLLGGDARPDRGEAFAGFVGFARSLAQGGGKKDKKAKEVAERTPGPVAYAPSFIGQPDGGGYGWTLSAGIALVEISGPLLPEGFCWTDWDGGQHWVHGYDTLSQTYAEIAADERVSGVFTRHESPGGYSDDGIITLAAQLRDLRAEKPHFSWCKQSCSADYWISSQSTRVFAPGLGNVGSIGAYMAHCSAAGMLEQDGVVIDAIEFPEGKTDGAWWKALSPEARADWQSEVTHVARLFFEDVELGRPNLSGDIFERLRASAFYGRNRDQARSAIDLGLIDAVSSEIDAFEALKAFVRNPTALSPAASPAATAASTANQEIDMDRASVTAALKRAGISDDDQAKIMAELPKAEEAAASEGEAEAAEPADEDDATGETPAEGDKKDPEASAPDGATVLAIMDLPEAKGREKLARTLAGKPGMTAASAKEILAAAPKASALKPEDPQLSRSAAAPQTGDVAEGRAAAQRFKEMKGGKSAAA